MGERRTEAALREDTDTQHVNIVAGALASVPGAACWLDPLRRSGEA
jgi:hypothetical protein